MPPSFPLAQRSILFFTSCSNFFLLPGLTIHQNHRIIQESELKKMGRDPETKRNIHFTDPADDSCCIMCVSSSPLFFFSPFFFYCGNVLQVCCILTCKSRRIIDFLTSLEDNQRIKSQARCDGLLRFPVCLFRVIACVARRHE